MDGYEALVWWTDSLSVQYSVQVTFARQFNSLLTGFSIIFGLLLLSALVLRDPAPGILLGLVAGGTSYLVSHERASLASRSVGFMSLLAGTALFLSLLQLLGKAHPMMVPTVELSVEQFSLCVIGVVLGPCLIFYGGARVAFWLAGKGPGSDGCLEL